MEPTPPKRERFQEKCSLCGHTGYIFHINGSPSDRKTCFGKVLREKISKKEFKYFCDKCGEDILGNNEYIEVYCDRCLKRGVVLTKGQFITPLKGTPASTPSKGISGRGSRKEFQMFM